MGGGIAQSVALARPDLRCVADPGGDHRGGRCRRPAPPGRSPALAATFESPPPDPDWSDRDAVIDWYLEGERHDVGHRSRWTKRGSGRIAGSVFDRSIDPASAGNHWLVIGSGDGEPLDVRRITVPTLVVHGTLDPLFPLPHGEALAAAIPGAALLVVEGMGHQVPPPSTWTEVVPAVLEHTSHRPR